MLVRGDFSSELMTLRGRSSDEKVLSSSYLSKSLLSVALCDCWEIEPAGDSTLDATDSGDCRSDEGAGKPKGREGDAHVP